MSQGTAVQLRAGLTHPANVYAQLKNGSIWRFATPMHPKSHSKFAARIEAAGFQLKLKYWIKIKNSDGTLVRS